MLDASGRIRRFTPSAEKLLGLIPADVGRPMSEIESRLKVPDIDDLVRDSMDNMTGYEREVRDGDGLWHLLRIRPYRTLEHRIDGAVVSLVDIDNLKRNHDQLIEADRNKDEFLAMLGHELRNPLAPLRNVVEVLKSSKTSPADADRALAIMNRQIGNMARLVDDLLDVSRITLSQIELRTELLDLCAVARRVADEFDSGVRSRGQTLHIGLPGMPVFVAADPVRLDQMIGNLVDNASKYSGEGGGIRITVGHATAEGAVGIVRVEDDGIGISAEKLPLVFDLFMRATRSGGRHFGGLGVGLTLVKRLAELHGGTITAHSAGEGRGSEFTLRLPSVDSAPRERATNSEEA